MMYHDEKYHGSTGGCKNRSRNAHYLRARMTPLFRYQDPSRLVAEAEAAAVAV